MCSDTSRGGPVVCPKQDLPEYHSRLGVTGMYGVVYDNVKRFCRISRLCTSSEQDEKYPGRGGDFHTFVASRHESNWNMWSSIIRIKAGDYFLNTYHLTTKSEQYKKGS